MPKHKPQLIPPLRRTRARTPPHTHTHLASARRWTACTRTWWRAARGSRCSWLSPTRSASPRCRSSRQRYARAHARVRAPPLAAPSALTHQPTPCAARAPSLLAFCACISRPNRFRSLAAPPGGGRGGGVRGGGGRQRQGGRKGRCGRQAQGARGRRRQGQEGQVTPRVTQTGCVPGAAPCSGAAPRREDACRALPCASGRRAGCGAPPLLPAPAAARSCACAAGCGAAGRISAGPARPNPSTLWLCVCVAFLECIDVANIVSSFADALPCCTGALHGCNCTRPACTWRACRAYPWTCDD